jgi:branched-chain amino acid transport system substrate-binding protein
MQRAPLTNFVAAAALLCILVSTSAVRAQAPSKPFIFGAVLPKTGAYSQYGDFTEQGLRAGIKEINDKGGILGRKVEFVVRDDASNPGRSLLAAKELLTEQNVDFLYPEIISGLVLATLPYASESKVFTVSNGASPLIGDAKKFPYSFQLSDLATKRLPAMAAAMKKLGGTKVGILVSTNPPQVALGDALNADLVSKYGMQVAGYKQFTVDSKDLTPQLQGLRDAGADIIAFDTAARDNVRVAMAGMQTLGWKAKLVTEPAALYGDLREQVPEPVADQFYAVNYRIGTRYGSPSPELKAFIDDMKQIGPIQNLAISAIARDVVFLVKWASETAQSEHGNATSDSIKTVLETMSKRQLPAGYSLALENPGYNAGDHTTANANYSQFWGLIHVSPLVDGAYEGEPLTVD